jgi:signal transduction histidine kinase
MNIFSRIVSFFRLTEEEKGIYREEISLGNSRRAMYLALVAVPVSLVHIVFFWLKLGHVQGTELVWAKSILLAHSVLLVVSAVVSALLYFMYYRKRRNTCFSRLLANLLLLFLLVIGSVLTMDDQRVTSAITPYLNTTLIVGLFFLIRPMISTLYYGASYLVYFVAISQTQMNSEVLISNQLNGISITAIGLCLSIIFWRSNMTKIKQRNQISKQNVALTESNAEKDKFFSIIAHDLKSPFNSILGFSDLLVKQVREKDYEGVEQYADIIRQSSNSAMDLLMNLMEWSKAQTGRLAFDPEEFELNELILESEDLFSGAILQKKIRLTNTIPGSTVVLADKNMIRTVLRNLISNAIKFSQVEGVIELSVVGKPSEFVVSVADNGVGISKETLSKLFRIDENHSTLGTQQEKGTGLGLILCKELIEKHSGKIWGESEPGKGSTFYFTLPI